MSILKRITRVIDRHFILSNSLLPKDISVTRYRPIVCTNLFKYNISLSIVDDAYSFTRVSNTLSSLITSIETLKLSSCWYNLSDNVKVSLYELLRLEEYVFLSILKTCGAIRQKKVNGKMIVLIVKEQWILFIIQYELTKVGIIKSKVSVVAYNNQSRRDVVFIRIRRKSTSSYTKATTQFNIHILSPLIKMRQLSRNFLNSISIDVLEKILV